MMNSILKRICMAFMLLILTNCASIERLAIPSATLISAELQNIGTQSHLSHQAWDSFLQHYTQLGDDGIVRVDYAAVNHQDKQKLNAYIKELSNHDVSQFTRNTQLAYWINLYNALTVSVILEHYPVSSIRDIRNGWFDFGPWNDKRITVDGREISLHDIENGIVRPLWPNEPNTHYALNCAALGCPNLAQKAYTADNVMHLLEENAALYINHPRGVSVADDGDITLSKIYSWYRGDFGGSDKAITNHLKRYATPNLKKKLEQSDTINRFVYDWSLNDTSTISKP